MSQLRETAATPTTRRRARTQAAETSRGPWYDIVFATELVRLRPTLKAGAVALLQNEAAAEDLVQDTLERALVNQRSFRAGSNLKAWTNSIMHNLFVDRWRRPEVRRRVPIDRVPWHPQHEAPSVGPIDILVSADILTAMAGLPAHQRQIFELAYFQRAGHRAIATQFGIHVATIGTSLFRTRAKLRKTLFETYLRKLSGSPYRDLHFADV